MLIEELAVFGLTRQEFKPTMHHTPGEHANNCITDEVKIVNDLQNMFPIQVYILARMT